LTERVEQIDERAEHYVGLIAASIYNAQRQSDKQKVLKPEDFFRKRGLALQRPERAKGVPFEEDNVLARMDRFAAMRGLNNAGEQAANEEAERLKREALKPQ
jgi:hypothetical protein